MAQNPLYFREVYKLKPGQASAFARRYKEAYSDGLRGLGLREVALWQTVPTQGKRDECIALWELDSAADVMRLSRALDSADSGDAGLQAARDALSALIEEREGWGLLRLESMLSVAEMDRRGMHRRFCLYEEIDLHPNQYDLFDKALRTNYLRLLEGSRIRLIGALRPQVLSIEAVVLWDLGDGWDSLAWLDEIDGTPALQHWQHIAQTARHAQRGRLLARTE